MVKSNDPVLVNEWRKFTHYDAKFDKSEKGFEFFDQSIPHDKLHESNHKKWFYRRLVNLISNNDVVQSSAVGEPEGPDSWKGAEASYNSARLGLGKLNGCLNGHLLVLYVLNSS